MQRVLCSDSVEHLQENAYGHLTNVAIQKHGEDYNAVHGGAGTSRLLLQPLLLLLRAVGCGSCSWMSADERSLPGGVVM